MTVSLSDVPEILPETTHFGFTRINAGEAFSKNGWAITDADRVKLDDVLYALATHTHTGDAPLGDPTDPPTFAVSSTGGNLPAATTFYYRVSFIDQYGLETAASPEDSATTADPIAPPPAPSGSVQSASGTVTPGVYSYLITYYDPYGGETTPSGINNVQVTGGTTNRIQLNFGGLPTGVVGIRIYRSRPGQSQFYYLDETSASSYLDSGQVEDQTVTVPSQNTTNAANSISVTIPLGFIPLGCTAWNIYRATDAGDYDGESLVHQVVEGVTDTSQTPRTVWVDTGDILTQGFPMETSSTMGTGNLLTLNEVDGQLPLTAIPRGVQELSWFAPGSINNGQTLTVTEAPGQVMPTRLTAFFATPPTSQVTIRITDVNQTHVDLVCNSPASGDPAGYFHTEWPVIAALAHYMSDTPGNSAASDLPQDAPFLTVSDSTAVGLISDELADTGQSLLLDQPGEWGQMNMDVLEAFTYTAYCSIRTNETTTASGDITLSVVRLDSNQIVASQAITVPPNTTGFVELGSLSFTAPGGVAIALRVTKGSSTTNTYEVEYVRFQTDIPTLAPGRLIVTAVGSSGAADANCTLWF